MNRRTDDPSRLFARLRELPIPQARLDELSARVAASIDAERSSAVPDPRPTIYRWRWAAPIAASLLLCSLLMIPLATHRLEEPLWATPMVPIVPLGEVTSMELISSPGEAKTLDLELGEAHVLMIFDESIEL